jgi:hypothetical protein
MQKGNREKLELWVTVSGGVLALAAFVISAAAFYFGEVRRQKDIPFEVVPKAYEKYYEMNKIELEKPYLTHMFVTPDRYPGVKGLVMTAAGKPSEQQRAQYLLEERAVADFLFTYYEQTLYQWGVLVEGAGRRPGDQLRKDHARRLAEARPGRRRYAQGGMVRRGRAVRRARQGCGLQASYLGTNTGRCSGGKLCWIAGQDAFGSRVSCGFDWLRSCRLRR